MAAGINDSTGARAANAHTRGITDDIAGRGGGGDEDGDMVDEDANSAATHGAEAHGGDAPAPGAAPKKRRRARSNWRGHKGQDNRKVAALDAACSEARESADTYPPGAEAGV